MKLKDIGFLFLGVILTLLVLFLNKTGLSFSYPEKPNTVRSFIYIETIQKALRSYFEACHKYPSSEEGLSSLLVDSKECRGYRKPDNLAKEKFKDRLGREFIYESDGNKYILKSQSTSWIEGSDTEAASVKNIDPNYLN